ncbi:superoxide dismutase family protein [Aliiglaciecola sp. CAU 1673]|uniref:tetratricopeptide repeat protein n=1 Tax=Aliiglaciecola sp. CAU 1673 TaxID=3032595 RepID=UPI0023D9BE9A|nr:tetratricopeptide repeat protein [Aliiglaciecola sp. CAU 1673]MDF2177045.1 superoxide dismutase family protein [Aliiglaciecola sp. CAU 1673]
MELKTQCKLVLIGLTLCWQAHATVITEKVDENSVLFYSSGQTQLFESILENQLIKSVNLLDKSMLMSGQLAHRIGDEKALNFIFDLLRKGDERGGLALANYIQRYPQDLLAYHFAAIQMVRNQQYPEAELTLKNILGEVPDYAPSRTLLGVVELQQGDYESAKNELEKAIAGPAPDTLAMRYLAWLSLKNRETTKARWYLERALKYYGLPTKEANILHLELAELYRRLGQPERIVVLFTPLLQNQKLDMKNPANVEAVSRYLEAATSIGELVSAQRGLQKLEGTEALNSFPGLISSSRILAMQGKYKESLHQLNELKSEVPSLEKQRLLETARIQVVAGQSEQAMASAEEYINKAKRADVSAMRNYVEVAVQAGKGNQALTYLYEQAKQSPEDQAVQSLLVETLLSAGDMVAAKSQLEAQLNKNSQSVSALYQYGVLLYNQRDNAKAKQSFEQVVKLQPSNEDAWLALLGAAHDHREHDHSGGGAMLDHQEVMPILEQAIAANPLSYRLHYEKGITAYSGGEAKLALRTFEQTLELAPFYIPAMYMAAIASADLGDNLEKAKKLAEVAVQIQPDVPAVADALGWVLIQSGEIEKGEPLCRKALEGMPNDPAVLLHLGVAEMKKAKTSSAKSYLMAALAGQLPSHSAKYARAMLQEMEPVSEKQLEVHKINGFGKAENIGTITLKDVENGLEVKANLNGLPAGFNGMHFHEKPSCEAGMKDGQRVAGLLAGEHYGHDHMAMMGSMSSEEHAKHMANMKPRGDLPPLETKSDGTSNASVMGAGLTLAELRGRSLMIHHGPDEDGSSGPKIACAIID